MTDLHTTQRPAANQVHRLPNSLGDGPLEEALERVESTVRRIAWGVHEVLQVVYEELRGLIPAINACSVQVIDAQTRTATSYQISERKVKHWPMRILARTPVEMAWREQRAVYRPDLEADDPYDEAWWLRTDDLYGMQVRCVVDVPFRHGTLAVNSVVPNAFDARDLDILHKMAMLLELGCDAAENPDAFRQRAESVRANTLLTEDNWLLAVLHEITQSALTVPDLGRALDALTRHVSRSGALQRLLVAAVDYEAQTVTVTRRAGRLLNRSFPSIGHGWLLDDQRILAEAVRTGETQVVDSAEGPIGWWPSEPEDGCPRPLFIVPIQRGERTVMLLIGDGPVNEQDETWHKLRRVQSALGQVLVNIEYARLYAEAQSRSLALTTANEALRGETIGPGRTEGTRFAVESELEEQHVLRMRSDRLRSLGEMAAGIAHELNQPLVGVRGLAEYVLIAMERGWDLSEDEIRDNQRLIVEQADRMTHIVDHVRMFARDAISPDVSPVQVNEVVQAAEGLLGAQFRSRGLELVSSLTQPLPKVLANPFSLEEVLLNLLINARDAVEERLNADPVGTSPRVAVRTSVERRDRGDCVTIEVEDEGVGIPEHLLPKVFDPFFTTKGPDKGTGLGLAISMSIVEQYGGSLRLLSAPGRGTTATVSLPATDS